MVMETEDCETLYRPDFILFILETAKSCRDQKREHTEKIKGAGVKREEESREQGLERIFGI